MTMQPNTCNRQKNDYNNKQIHDAAHTFRRVGTAAATMNEEARAAAHVVGR